MKRPLYVLILGLAAIAAIVHADEANNLDVARGMIDAINARDLERLDEFVASNVVRHSAATAGVTVTSLAEFKAFLQSDFESVPDSVMEIDILFGNDRFVGMRALYSGTQTGRMGPFPPSGRRFQLPFIGILRFEDDKVAEIWVEWDNVYALRQLGHFDAPSGE